MMKKNIFISVFVIYNCFLFAQIPYATQQPKWYMAVYVKDATGKKDTVYIGHDLSAQNGSGTPQFNDANFGEIYFTPQNPNQFKLATFYWSSPSDSLGKVDIQNFFFTNQLYYTISFDSVTFPVIITWDLAKLRSDSLPFPNQGLNIPEAQIELNYPGGQMYITYPVMTCNQNLPIIVSDTINSSCYCFTKDSLVLADFFGNPAKQTAGIDFYVKPWTGQTPLSIKENKYNNFFTIAPNPFTNFIQVILNSKPIEFTSYNVIIYNSIGNEIIRTSFTDTITNINTVDLTNGIYCIKVLSEKGELLYLKKIIKN